MLSLRESPRYRAIPSNPCSPGLGSSLRTREIQGGGASVGFLEILGPGCKWNVEPGIFEIVVVSTSEVIRAREKFAVDSSRKF